MKKNALRLSAPVVLLAAGLACLGSEARAEQLADFGRPASESEAVDTQPPGGDAAPDYAAALSFLTSEEGPALAADEAESLARKVVGGGPDRTPDLKQLYAFLYQCGGGELTKPDAARIAARLAASGVSQAAARFEFGWSVYAPAPGKKESSREAVEFVAGQVEKGRVPQSAEGLEPALAEYTAAYKFAFHPQGPDVSRKEAARFAAILAAQGPGSAAEFESIYRSIYQAAGGRLSKLHSAEAAARAAQGKGAALRFERALAVYAPASPDKERATETFDAVVAKMDPPWAKPDAGQEVFEKAYRFAFNSPGPDLSRKDADRLAQQVRDSGPDAAEEFEAAYRLAYFHGGGELTPLAAAEIAAQVAGHGKGAAARFETELASPTAPAEKNQAAAVRAALARMGSDDATAEPRMPAPENWDDLPRR